MRNNCNYLFVYGTLLYTNNEFGVLLKNNSRYLMPASFNGLLYDIGDYPGALYIPASQQQVWGNIMQLSDDPEVLKALDKYEGYGPHYPYPNEFIRKIVPVQTTLGLLNCWVYLYNLPVDGYPLIASGKYPT